MSCSRPSEKLSSKPIRHVIVTSVDPDHTGGNERLSSAGTYVRLLDTFDPRGTNTRRFDHGSCQRARAHERPERQRSADGARRLAERHLFHRRLGAARERRGNPADSRSRGAHRRRHDGVLSPLRRDQHGRHLHDHRLSAIRSGARRQRRRHPRRLEPRDRARDRGREPDGRHRHRARATAESATRPRSRTTAT